MSSRTCCGINELHAPLVLRALHEDSTHNPKEMSALRAELVLRDVPGKSVQGRRGCGGVGPRRTRGGSSQNPSSGEVVRLSPTPACLGLLAPDLLTRRRGTSPLAITYPRVRVKPLTTDPTRARLGHTA